MKKAIISCVLLIVIILSCEQPIDPTTNIDNARATIFLVNSRGEISSTQISDTMQSDMTVGVATVLPTFIASIHIEIRSESGLGDTNVTWSNQIIPDTLKFQHVFRSIGEHTITATLVRVDSLQFSRNAKIIIVGRRATIIDDPQSIDVAEGDTTELGVTVAGESPISYQWYRDDILLPGEISALLTFGPAVIANSGGYFCVVKNSWGGPDTSATAIVHVAPKATPTNNRPILTVTGESKVKALDTARLILSVSDIDIQQGWRLGVIHGPSLGVLIDNNYYWVPRESDTGLVQIAFMVVDSGLPPLSDTATMQIVVRSSSDSSVCPVIARQSSYQVISNGKPASLFVTASGTLPLHYNWYKKNDSVGTNSSYFSIASTQPSDSGAYVCIVSNVCGSDTSDPMVISVSETDTVLPIIAAQPEGDSVIEGSRAVLWVDAYGTAITYQWFKNGKEIQGANRDSLAFSSIALSDSGNYSVKVSNTRGADSSNVARLKVVAQYFTISVSAGAYGTITPAGTNGSVAVKKGTSQVFTIAANAGYRIKEVLIDGKPDSASRVTGLVTFSNVSSSHALSASFEASRWTLDVITSNGKVTIVPDLDTFRHDSTAILSAIADSGYEFAGWSGDSISDANPITLRMTHNMTITANFAKIGTYSINLTQSNGTVTKSPEAPSYSTGTRVVLRAIPALGYRFSGWQGDTTAGPDSLVLIIGSKSLNVTALFVKIRYVVRTTSSTGGTISRQPDTDTCDSHSRVVFTAVPAPNYTFVNWTGSLGGSGNPDSLLIDTNRTVGAVFSLKSCVLTINQVTGGSVSAIPSGPVYLYGTPIIVTALPDSIHIFSSWTGAMTGNAPGSDTLIMDSSKTVGAAFALKKYLISTNAGAHGTIAPVSPFVEHGQNQIFTITSEPNCHIESIVVDGTPLALNPLPGSYTFTNVRETHSLEATFGIDGYVITTTAGTGGIISPVNPVVMHGANQTIDITPDSGYHITTLTVDGAVMSPSSTYSFNDVIAAHAIAATFAINTHMTTTTAGVNGTITPANPLVNHGGNQTFSITPDTGYHVATLTVDGTVQTPAETYTFANVTATHAIAATFAINTYAITTTAGTNGTITPVNPSVNHGSNQAFSIAPGTGYHVATLTVDGTTQTPAETHTFVNVTATHAIAATFAVNTYAITTTVGANGAITPVNPTVNHGNNQVFSIAPSDGYHVATLTVDGTAQTPAETHTFVNVTAAHAIAATFAINTYTITTTAGANGTIAPANPAVKHGDNQVFTISPNDGYRIASVMVDNLTQVQSGTYSFTNVTSAHTIAATFAPKWSLIYSYPTDSAYLFAAADDQTIFKIAKGGSSIIRFTANGGASWSYFAQPYDPCNAIQMKASASTISLIFGGGTNSDWYSTYTIADKALLSLKSGNLSSANGGGNQAFALGVDEQGTSAIASFDWGVMGGGNNAVLKIGETSETVLGANFPTDIAVVDGLIFVTIRDTLYRRDASGWHAYSILGPGASAPLKCFIETDLSHGDTLYLFDTSGSYGSNAFFLCVKATTTPEITKITTAPLGATKSFAMVSGKEGWFITSAGLFHTTNGLVSWSEDVLFDGTDASALTEIFVAADGRSVFAFGGGKLFRY